MRTLIRLPYQRGAHYPGMAQAGRRTVSNAAKGKATSPGGRWRPKNATAPCNAISLAKIASFPHNANVDPSTSTISMPLELVVRLKDDTWRRYTFEDRSTLDSELSTLMRRLDMRQYKEVLPTMGEVFRDQLLAVLEGLGIDNAKVVAEFKHDRSNFGLCEQELRWSVDAKFRGLHLEAEYEGLWNTRRDDIHQYNWAKLNHAPLEITYTMIPEDEVDAAIKSLIKAEPFWRKHADVMVPLMRCIAKFHWTGRG